MALNLTSFRAVAISLRGEADKPPAILLEHGDPLCRYWRWGV
jgi:hypothetical protein